MRWEKQPLWELLESSWQRWQETKEGEEAFVFLCSLGRLRRTIEKEGKGEVLQSYFLNAASSVKTLLEGLEKAFSSRVRELEELVQKLKKSETGVEWEQSFFEVRDTCQWVLEACGELIEAFWPDGKATFFALCQKLGLVDREVLLYRSVVEKLWSLAEEEREAFLLEEPDQFWWRFPPEPEDCYMPLLVRSYWQGAYLGNLLFRPERELYEEHLKNCHQCRQEIEPVIEALMRRKKQLLAQFVVDTPRLAASANLWEKVPTRPIHPTYCDGWGEWQVKVNLAFGPGQVALVVEKPQIELENWSFRLGEESYPIASQERLALVPQAEWRYFWLSQEPLVLCSPDEERVLYWDWEGEE